MAFKFISLLALVGAASAGFIQPAAPLHQFAYAAQPAAPLAYAKLAPIAKLATPVITKHIDEEYDPHPQYSYNYDVADSLTGDYKSQQETRDGDFVQGSYSLLESDGTKRIVDYTADAVNGFNAVVRKEPSTIALKAAPVYQAPAAIIKAAPIAYKAAPAAAYYPSAQYYQAAPLVQQYAQPLYHH